MGRVYGALAVVGVLMGCGGGGAFYSNEYLLWSKERSSNRTAYLYGNYGGGFRCTW